MDIAPKFRMMMLFAAAFLATWLIYWPILKIAREKNIVDNPGDRKLQKIPVPVMGGIAVFFGIVVGLCYFKTMLSYTSLFSTLGAMVIMLYVGTIDDISNLSPWRRLAVEVLVATLLVYGTHFSICNFQGLWGIGLLPILWSVPLSALAMVGIINAINMIDGVDGLVSGYCIMACTLFGLIFFLSFDYSYASLAAVSVGALIPFFIHNVFGSKNKMFIGDGGTMMMGTVLSSMVISLCRYRIGYDDRFLDHQFGLIAFSLAVLSVPVFDTLRVIFWRVIHGRSPFSADKNHLHHLLIEAGLPHFGVTMAEIALNMAVVAAWAVSWSLGANVSTQFYVVVAASCLLVFGTAAILHLAFRRRSVSAPVEVSSYESSADQ